MASPMALLTAPASAWRDGDDGVGRVGRCDTREAALEQLEWRQLPRADHAPRLDRRQIASFTHVGLPPLLAVAQFWLNRN
jgi:hypothetical protein